MTDSLVGAPTGPLSGLRVVEQGSFITGPFASLLLADMGAEVVKIERPDGGDPFRHHDGTSYASTFRSVNRNKRSITLDNHEPADRDVLHDLVASADVFIHNFRGDAAARMGIDSDTLLGVNPRLIYCGISGLGRTGPYAARPAYDTVAQSLSGMLSTTLDPDDPRIAGPATADAITGLYAAQGILAALHQRSQDGRGHVVELSMLESMLHFLIEPYGSFFAYSRPPGPYGRAANSQSYAFTCADGLVLAVHLSSPVKFWAAILEAVGQQPLAADPRFRAFTDRVANYDSLRHELQTVFATGTRKHWLAELGARDVPCAPVLDLADVTQDPQFVHLGMEISALHPVEGLVRSIRPPHTFDGKRATTMAAPPRLGEHSAEIRAFVRQAAPVDGARSAS